MPQMSLLPLVDELLDQVPTLLEQVLKTEIENRAVTSQCTDLEKQIEELKREVVQERMKQKIITDQIAAAQGQARRHNFGSTSTPALAIRRRRQSVDMASDSPVSLRSKRKGRIFEEETAQAVAKKLRVNKENDWSVEDSTDSPA